MNSIKPFKVLSKKIVLDAPYYKVEEQLVELPNGEKTKWWIKKMGEVVVVVPFLPDGRVVLQKNYKHGAGRVITEVVAGMVDPNEPHSAAAARELTEETSYAAKKLVKVGQMYANPTSTEFKYHVFAAFDCEKVEKGNDLEKDAAEQIETFVVKDLGEAKKVLHDEKTLTSSTTLSALALVCSYVEKNKRL